MIKQNQDKIFDGFVIVKLFQKAISVAYKT